MFRALLASLLFVVVCTAQDYYAAALEGAQVVPPATGSASGFGVLRYDPTSGQLRVFVHAEGLGSPVTSCAVRVGAAGATGASALALTASGSGAWTGSKLLNAVEAAALGSAGLYLEIRTTLQPLGEVRGQIVTSASSRFRAQLTGAQQVPPVATAATGQLEAFFYEPERRLVYFLVNVGVTSVLGADLHRAAVGNNGPLVTALDGLAANGIDFCGATDRLSAVDAGALLGNDVYVNLRTAASPTGELRGQLERDLGPFVGGLSSNQVVPPTPSTAVGGVQVAVRPDGTVAVGGAFSALLGTATAVEVRRAPPLSNGPLVFTVPLSGQSFSGTHVPTSPQLNDLLAGNWYVTVNSSAHRQGEVRAQLLVGSRPTTYGRGCTGSNGKRPKIGARQGAVIGAPFSMDLFAANPNQIALLGFGPERDQFATLSLPLPAPQAGVAAPGCTLLLAPQLLEPRVTDVSGCATVALTLPVAPNLRGSLHCAQWIVLDPSANAAGLTSSDALYFAIE